MQRIVVVLPAPFGPRKPVTLPGSMPNVKSSTATLSPYRFVSPRTSIMETGPLQEPFEKSSQQGKKVASRPSSSCPSADCRRVARGDDYAILLQDEPLSADTEGRGRSTGRGRGWQWPRYRDGHGCAAAGGRVAGVVQLRRVGGHRRQRRGRPDPAAGGVGVRRVRDGDAGHRADRKSVV